MNCKSCEIFVNITHPDVIAKMWLQLFLNLFRNLPNDVGGQTLRTLGQPHRNQGNEAWIEIQLTNLIQLNSICHKQKLIWNETVLKDSD